VSAGSELVWEQRLLCRGCKSGILLLGRTQLVRHANMIVMLFLHPSLKFNRPSAGMSVRPCAPPGESATLYPCCRHGYAALHLIHVIFIAVPDQWSVIQVCQAKREIPAYRARLCCSLLQ
jgi:hypothetical protein